MRAYIRDIDAAGKVGKEFSVVILGHNRNRLVDAMVVECDTKVGFQLVFAAHWRFKIRFTGQVVLGRR
jgi:hypothetical protein